MWNLLVSLMLGALTAGVIILVFLLRLGLRARHANPDIGAARMVGLKGKAVTAVAADGRVSVQGEYWWARSRAPIAEGEKVIVVGIDKLTLEVEPCPDKAAIPRPVSAVEPREIQDT
jgi:membrane-bound ClpP family serine protease